MIDIVTKVDQKTGKTRMLNAGFDPDVRKVVRVEPANEHVRRVLKHGVTKVGFLAEGAAEWPNDTFTKRRILDGDVRVVVAEQPQPEQPEQQAVKSAKKLPPPDKS